MCNEDGKHEDLANTIISLVVNCGGLILTLAALICLATDHEMDQSLRLILVSYSIANLMGPALLLYDTIADTCNHIMTVSVILTLCHLMILLLAEYHNIASNRQRTVKDFVGLIIISWIISFTVGMVNVVSMHDIHVIFSSLYLSFVFLLLATYIAIFRKHKKKNQLKRVYQQTFLVQNCRQEKGVKGFWMLKLFAVIVFSYAVCAMPWLTNEFRNALGLGPGVESLHKASVIMYSVNFYFPSGSCVYLRCMQWMSGRGKTRKRVHSTYRFRDIY